MVDNILVNEIVVKDLNEKIMTAKYVLEDNIHLIKIAQIVVKEQVNRCEELEN